MCMCVCACMCVCVCVCVCGGGGQLVYIDIFARFPVLSTLIIILKIYYLNKRVHMVTYDFCERVVVWL